MVTVTCREIFTAQTLASVVNEEVLTMNPAASAASKRVLTGKTARIWPTQRPAAQE
jgi:hypothetical protein